jgi:PhzF family phenazine biosynthesis protein
MPQEIYQVDAFAERPFTGNPAAVCLLPTPADEVWMQNVAREMNLSETAFLVRRDDGFDLRWFTPKVEVDLCGHATLASAHVLWETGELGRDEQARFHTRSGLLTATIDGDEIAMDFPARPPVTADPPAGMLAALGADPVHAVYCEPDYLVELQDEQTVRDLVPDISALTRTGIRGVMVTAAGAGEHDFVSRFFAPGAGVDEDPVTGSAHCALGSYWQERTGRDEFVAFQASARGGVVRVECRGDRVILRGRAVTVLRAELVVP